MKEEISGHRTIGIYTHMSKGEGKGEKRTCRRPEEKTVRTIGQIFQMLGTY